MSGDWPQSPRFSYILSVWTTPACTPTVSLPGASATMSLFYPSSPAHWQESALGIHFSNQKRGSLSPCGVPSLGPAHSRCGLCGRRKQVGEAGLGLLPAQAQRAGTHPEQNKGRRQAGRRGWAGCGPASGGPGTSHWRPVPMPGPCGAHPGLRAGQRRQRAGGPPRVAPPSDSAQAGPPQGGQWWPVGAGRASWQV